VEAEDFDNFDYILAMDSDNYETLMWMAGDNQSGKDKVMMFRTFDPDGSGSVPDPYYGGDEGFENVFKMCERTCRALLEKL
jgi:protein-tyrosine phosphatase